MISKKSMIPMGMTAVTMGISPYRDGMTIQAMMDDADAKLYWGKQHGKNQVVSVLPEETAV